MSVREKRGNLVPAKLKHFTVSDILLYYCNPTLHCRYCRQGLIIFHYDPLLISVLFDTVVLEVRNEHMSVFCNGHIVRLVDLISHAVNTRQEMAVAAKHLYPILSVSHQNVSLSVRSYPSRGPELSLAVTLAAKLP